MSDASKPFSVEGNYLTLDPDLYDTDSDEGPDPGLLEENGELARPSLRRDFSQEPKAPRAAPQPRALQEDPGCPQPPGEGARGHTVTAT